LVPVSDDDALEPYRRQHRRVLEELGINEPPVTSAELFDEYERAEVEQLGLAERQRVWGEAWARMFREAQRFESE
jgi:hypothetical protein